MSYKRIGDMVYVPCADSRLRREILPGAGIVGTPQPGTPGLVLIDYEGNKYGSEAFATYEDRIYHAFDRHTWGENGYPTVARQLVDKDELLEVGFLLIPGEISDAMAQHRAALQFGGHGFKIPPPMVEQVKREMRKPQLVIDRQDVVDEWCALAEVAV